MSSNVVSFQGAFFAADWLLKKIHASTHVVESNGQRARACESAKFENLHRDNNKRPPLFLTL
jgi:hypothetical protein